MSSYPTPDPQAVFYQQYFAVHREEVAGVLLALFLGGFGAHKFYLHQTGLGILYLCFFWTPFPWIAGFIECFFMPGRVREFNAFQAAYIASRLGLAAPPWQAPLSPAAGALTACPRCQRANPPDASYCPSCGTRLR